LQLLLIQATIAIKTHPDYPKCDINRSRKFLFFQKSEGFMNILLWVLQILMGVYFIAIGVMHFVIPPGLPEPMSWMYDLSPTLHAISGTAEILGGLGLILPGLAKIQTRLTPLAGVGLALVMVLAAVFHLTRGEMLNIVTNLVVGAVVGFIAYGRWKLKPLPDRSSSQVRLAK
jgi:putative oxidoreductase